MADYLIQDSTLTGIADAIRLKTGGTSAMTPAEMATAIGSIETGGGEPAPAAHSVQLTLASSSGMVAILRAYCRYAIYWRIYPTDAENTAVNTIAIGQGYYGSDSAIGGNPIGSAVSGTGVTLAAPPDQFRVNDQSYNTTRIRSGVNSKPAGAYQLDFYGVAK